MASSGSVPTGGSLSSMSQRGTRMPALRAASTIWRWTIERCASATSISFWMPFLTSLAWPPSSMSLTGTSSGFARAPSSSSSVASGSTVVESFPSARSAHAVAMSPANVPAMTMLLERPSMLFPLCAATPSSIASSATSYKWNLRFKGRNAAVSPMPSAARSNRAARSSLMRP